MILPAHQAAIGRGSWIPFRWSNVRAKRPHASARYCSLLGNALKFHGKHPRIRDFPSLVNTECAGCLKLFPRCLIVRHGRLDPITEHHRLASRSAGSHADSPPPDVRACTGTESRRFLRKRLASMPPSAPLPAAMSSAQPLQRPAQPLPWPAPRVPARPVHQSGAGQLTRPLPTPSGLSLIGMKLATFLVIHDTHSGAGHAATIRSAFRMTSPRRQP